MREVYLINKYKFRSILNRFLYTPTKGRRMKSKYFLFLVGSFIIIITFSALSSFTSSAVGFMLDILEPLNRKEQMKWAGRLFLLMILSILTSNVYPNVYRVLEFKDFKLLSSVVSSVKRIVLSKLLGRELLKGSLLFVIFLLFFIHITLELNLSLATVVFLFLYITSIIAIAATLKMYIVMKIILAKLRKGNGLNYSLFLLFARGMMSILFFSILYPFIDYVPIGTVRGYYIFIYNHSLIQSLLLFLTPFQIFDNMWIFPSISIITGISFCWLMGKSLKHLEAHLFIDFLQQKNSNDFQTDVVKNGLFSMYLSSLSTLLKYLTFIPFLTRRIIVKDYKHFQRKKQYRFTQTFLLIIFQYILLFFPYYLLASKNIFFIEGNLSILAILHLSGSVMVIDRLINRFSPDFEGERFIYILLTSVKVEQICLAKVLSLLGVALPFPILISLATCLVFDANFLLNMPLVVLTTIVAILIALVCSITFPNFERETYLDLPSTRASIMSKLLAGLFIIIGSAIIIFSKNPLLTVILFSSMALLISWFLFHLCCKKLNKTEFKNFASLSEFSE